MTIEKRKSDGALLISDTINNYYIKKNLYRVHKKSSNKYI